ncbi:MAG TPA: hypothetical protein VK327_07875, partial [Candidatus Paceibacterota bacterium]|nr:hypothetical protein [Candidatus Paceibacterota bacterium]
SMDEEQESTAERLPVQVVEHLHRQLGGDAHVEGMVLQFIGDKYGAATLFQLPTNVASEILKRPADFLRAVKEHCEPELF